MKKNRKLGQALIEYVLLLIIPVLLISVLPSLNETVNLTLNTVGVDLMESDEKVTPDYTPTPDECVGCAILYPPVAKFELPNNCGTKGIYRKGADIRLADVSYDTDPQINGEEQGRIDAVEWTITKYDADGNLVEECSTTHQDEVIHTTRIAGAVSEVTGLTLSMDGYGGVAQYKNCIRDPGRFVVTQRVFDNDGLLSKNTHTETFEIRDLRPSIYLSVEVAQDSTPLEGDFPTYVKEYSQSDSCRFDVPINGDYGDEDDYGLPEIRYSEDADVLYFDGLPYAYTEMCPRVEGATSGKATFRIESNDEENGTGNLLKDPDFISTQNGGDDEEIPEGASTELYGYQRHGFTYKSRYIQSEALYADDLEDANLQIIEFEDGATTYVKEFDNAGIYLYDVQVYDENLISAQGKGVQSRDNYQPDVGVAVRVISKLDPDYKDKCDPPIPTITCPKPHYILGITKTMNNSNNKIGPYYFSLGVVGTKSNNAKYTESDLISMVESNKIKDENNQSIKDKFLYSVSELEQELGMEVFTTPYSYGNGKTVQIPVFRPTNDDHLSIKALTYFPVDGIQYDECKSAGSSRYWATTNGFLNDFDFQKLESGLNAQWQPGEDKGDVWFEIQRPYDDNLQETLYYSAETIVNITQGMPLQDNQGKPIEHVEVLFGMARNNLAEQDYFGSGKIIASPFNGQLNSKGDNEPFTGTKEKTNPDGSTSEIKINNSSIRSNGQLLAIAPILKSCPTHDLRPIPYFSYITENDDIIQLTSRVQGMDPNTGSSLTWNLDTQNPPAGITCLDEGCFVTLTATESICGPEAQNCKINALRWKYSMYTHKPIPGTGPVTESEKNNAEVLIQDNILTRHFPLSDVSYYNNQTGSAYPKYDSIFYPKGVPDAYQVTTMDDSYDKTYSLPVNNNSSGSFIYYGEYNSATEIAAEDGVKTLKTPTFDFYGKNSYSVSEIRNSGTTAPNAQETYTDLDSPDIPAGNTASGMFLQAGTTYVYEIEVIDSQGCATSRTLTINVSDAAKEPLALCNYIDNKVEMEDLSNYKYYGGLVVQARSTEGTTGIVYNGDVVQMHVGNEAITDVELFTSPLYMYQRSRYNKANTVSTDDGEQVTINENPEYFLWDYNPDLLIAQELLERDQYNPRVGQIATGTNSFEGILNAAHSKVSKDSSREEDMQTINEITWTAYKADFTDEVVTVMTDPEYSPGGTTHEKVVVGPKEHLLSEKAKEAGVILDKVGENPTPVGVATTTNIEEYPVFPDGTFAEPGYYIIELTVAYTDQEGEKIISEPTQCKTKVTTPTLDFKCPWGETFEELEKTALNMQIQANSSQLSATDDLFSTLTAENNQLIAGGQNYNPNITDFEVTTQFNNDANDKDLIETQGTPQNYEVSIVDFDADKLNEFWNNLKQYGYLKSTFVDYEVCTADMVDDRPCEEFGADDSYGINAVTYQLGSEKLNPLTLHVLENPENSHVYTMQNQDAENPVVATETMTLQGWIVRERLTRDNYNVPGSAEYNPTNAPVYLASVPADLSDEEYRLINTPMTQAQITALDTFLSEISSIYPDLYDIKNNKFKISHMLKYTDKTKFSFIDLQPAALQASTGKFITNDTGSLKMTNHLYTQYTGIERVFDVSNGDETEACVQNNSIRKCNQDFSNSYGTFIYNSTKYNSTSFMGKYEAARRFQRLNYADYMRYVPGHNTDKISPIYIGYNYWQEWQFTSNYVRLNQFSFKNYYIDPLTVYVNNQGLVTEDGNPLNKILTVEEATSENLRNNVSGLRFENTLPSTLDTNSDFLLSSNTAEYGVDKDTLNNITWQHREILGRNDNNINNGASSITYIRVNAVNRNQRLADGSVNSHSKLCPVLVNAKPNNEAASNLCNIQYTTVPGDGSNILFTPDKYSGLLKNTNTGEYIVAGYDANLPGAYNIAAHSENLKSNSLGSLDLAKIHAPKSYFHTVGSKHNLADIDLDRNIVIEFIKDNANTTLETVVYDFYWQHDLSGYGTLFSIELDYNISSNPLNPDDNAAVEARADDVINQFRTLFYSAYANGETRYSNISGSNKTREVRPGESVGDIVWEYEKLAYNLKMKDANGAEMLGPEANRSCGFYAARQVQLYDPVVVTNPRRYKMEIGSWDYRVQFMSGTYSAPSKFIHWDRTYDAYSNNVYSMPEPNAYCLWTTRPMAGGGVAASYAANQVLGKYGDETHCITSGSKHSSPAQFITEYQARDYVKSYNLVNSANYNENKNYGTYAGFYWVDLYVTHSNTATQSEISNLCANGVPTASSSIGNVNSNGYWCRKGTMYALTDSQNVIEWLSGDNVNQAIIDQNGGASSDFRAALKARTDLAYNKPWS